MTYVLFAAGAVVGLLLLVGLVVEGAPSRRPRGFFYMRRQGFRRVRRS